MHNQNIDKENKLKINKPVILLFTEMGIFNNLRRKNIKDTDKPIIKNVTFQTGKSNTPHEGLVNLHMDTVEKVDELITKNETEINDRDPKLEINSKIDPTHFNRVEIREPITRSQEMSNINSEITPNDSLRELNKIEGFNEIQPYKNDLLENQKVNDNDFKNDKKVDRNNEYKKLNWGFLKNKEKRSKENDNYHEKNSNNNFSRTKDELERTKAEIEAKKRELELIEQREKEREQEQKKLEEEKRNREKLDLIEIQKQKKEIKFKEKESKKIEMKREKERKIEQKKLEKEKRKQEKLRQIELKKKMKEDKLKEKELKNIEMKREKERKIEQKKLDEENVRLQKDAEKEMEKKLELQKMEEQKLRQIELNKKIEEQKLREKIEAKKEMERQQEVQKMEEEKIRIQKEAEKEMEKKLEMQKVEEQYKEKEAYQPPINNEKDHVPKETIEKEKTQTKESPMIWDEDVEKLIPIIDSLLEKLPDEIIDEFAKSEDFTLYEKVILKYKNK